MGRTVARALLVAALLALGFVPPPAPASAAGFTPSFRGVSIRAHIEGSNGYDLRVLADRFGADDEEVTVGASKGRSNAFYILQRSVQVTARRVRADLGSRGRVSLDFHERGRHRVHDPRCRGYDVVRRGVFRGTVRFRGEHRYTHAKVHRAEGSVTIEGTYNCRSGGRSGGGPSRRPVVLSACNRRLDYFAAKRRPGTRAVHFAFLRERDGPVAIYRSTLRVGRAGTFTYADDLSTASIDPPSAFHGHGDYADGYLRGNATVSLLGVGRVSLAPLQASLSKGGGSESPCDLFTRAGARQAPAASSPPSRALVGMLKP